MFHIIVGVGYYLFSLSNSADAIGYWKTASLSTFDDIIQYLKFGGGTAFMYVFNYFPAGVFGLSYLAGTFIHIYLGFIGLLFFVYVAEQVIPFNSKIQGVNLFPLIFFLPNLHFWSSGVGKDSLSFLCIGLFAYSLLQIKRKWYFAIFAIVFLYFIRSHVAFLLLISAGAGYLMSEKVGNFIKIFASIVLFAGAIYVLPQVMEYTGLQDLSLESFTNRSSGQAGLLSEDSGSAIDISSYPLPLKILTFLYRPTFFDINSLPSLIAAFENILLLVLTVLAVRRNFISGLKAAPLTVVVLFVFLVLGSIVFSMSLGNLGIMLRMRNMVLPGMLIYFLWAFSWQSEEKYNKIMLLKRLLNKRNLKKSESESADM